jgi:hypothetical protein
MFARSIPWLAALLMLGLTATVQACPYCKESLAENGQRLVSGYFWSILFMMSMPFLILGGLSSYFYVQVVRARRGQRASAGGGEQFEFPGVDIEAAREEELLRV